jgi:hypothetical protein
MRSLGTKIDGPAQTADRSLLGADNRPGRRSNRNKEKKTRPQRPAGVPPAAFTSGEYE